MDNHSNQMEMQHTVHAKQEEEVKEEGAEDKVVEKVEQKVEKVHQ